MLGHASGNLGDHLLKGRSQRRITVFPQNFLPRGLLHGTASLRVAQEFEYGANKGLSAIGDKNFLAVLKRQTLRPN